MHKRFTNSAPVSVALVFLGAVMALVAPAWAGYQHVSGPLLDDPSKAQIFRLDNGLTVQVTENHDRPRFFAEIAVRAGGKDDPPETTGLAHYFEHLMFKGTGEMGTVDYAAEKPHLDRIEELYEAHFKETDPAKRAEIYRQIDAENQAAAKYAVANELDRLYSAMGGADINAHTGAEETVYEVNLPKNRLRQWAAVEAGRFANPVFRLFPSELETVYEEKNRSMDNKMLRIYEAVGKKLYKVHPYGQQTVLGSMDDLKNPSIRNIRHFFEQWYVPENMAVSISGDVDTKEVVAIVDEYFSALKPGKAPKQPQWKEKPLKGREYVETAFQGEEYVMLGFRTASSKSDDADALVLIDMILDNSTAGLINLNLNQQQRVRQAGAFPSAQNDYGAEYLFGVPKEGQSMEEVEKLLLEQVEIIKRGEFDDWILPAIVNDFKKQRKGGLESNAARTSALSSSFISGEPWEHAVTTIQRMEKIGKKEIVRVAKKYFGEGYVAGYRKDAAEEVPHVAKPELTKVEIDPSRQSKFAETIMAMPVPPIEPVYVEAGKDYKKVTGANGVDFCYAPNPINDLFTLAITVDVGTRQNNVIAPATLLLEKSGAGSFSAEDLKKEWYKLGADFHVSAGDNQTVITLSGLDENLDKSLKLLYEVMSNPKADDGTLEQLKGIILKEREDAKKQAPAIASAVVQFNRFGEDSSFRRLLPAEQLKALTVPQLRDTITALLHYKHRIAYAGSLPMDKVQAMCLAQYPANTTFVDPPEYRYLKARVPEKSEIYFFDKEAAQAQVRIEFGGPDYDPTKAAYIDLFNEYFSGSMAGLVFQELREARGLAYVAAARYMNGYRAKDQDLMVGIIQTQPDKTIEALNGFIDLMDRMPASEQRFAVSKDSLVNQYRAAKTGFREVVTQVADWERHGLQGDPRAEVFKAIQASGMPQMLEFQAAQVANKPKLISVTGPSAKIDIEALKKIGTVRVLTLKDIFVD